MAYTKLNLQDYKDKWTAEKVSHLEDGIFVNDERLNKLFSNGNSLSETEKLLMQDTLEITGLKGSELFNSILPLWDSLLSEGGKKIYPPAISFDGNIENKIIFTLDSDEGLGSFESGACYVRVGDPIESSLCLMTYGGLLHILHIMLNSGGIGINTLADTSSQNTMEDIPIDQTLYFNFLMAASAYPQINENMDEYYLSDSILTEFIRQNTLYQSFFPNLFEGPVALSAHQDFNYYGKTYPKGFYVRYINTPLMEYFIQMMLAESGESVSSEMIHSIDLPVFYIDNVWPLNAFFTSVPHIQKQPEIFENTPHVFKCGKETLSWDGISRLDLTDAMGVIMVSAEPRKFLDVCKMASSINVLNSDNEIEETLSLAPISLGSASDKALALGEHFIIIQDLMTIDNYTVAPGVYGVNDNPITIEFKDVDILSIYNKKINRDYYDCLAYEEEGYQKLLLSNIIPEPEDEFTPWGSYSVDNAIIQFNKFYLVKIGEDETYILPSSNTVCPVVCEDVFIPGLELDGRGNIIQCGSTLYFEHFPTSDIGKSIEIYEYKEHILKQIDSKFIPAATTFDLTKVLSDIPMSGEFVTSTSPVVGIKDSAASGHPVRVKISNAAIGTGILNLTFNYLNNRDIYQGVSTIYLDGSFADCVCQINSDEYVTIAIIFRGTN